MFRNHFPSRFWEQICFSAFRALLTPLFLGYPWLVHHNTQIDWEKGKITVGGGGVICIVFRPTTEHGCVARLLGPFSTPADLSRLKGGLLQRSGGEQGASTPDLCKRSSPQYEKT